LRLNREYTAYGSRVAGIDEWRSRSLSLRRHIPHLNRVNLPIRCRNCRRRRSSADFPGPFLLDVFLECIRGQRHGKRDENERLNDERWPLSRHVQAEDRPVEISARPLDRRRRQLAETRDGKIQRLIGGDGRRIEGRATPPIVVLGDAGIPTPCILGKGHWSSLPFITTAPVFGSRVRRLWGGERRIEGCGGVVTFGTDVMAKSKPPRLPPHRRADLEYRMIGPSPQECADPHLLA